MLRAVTRAIVILASVTSGAVAQTPPRDATAAPQSIATGTAVVKGRVIDAQTGAAIARVRVRLNWMGPGVQRPPITTDDSGGFTFSGLPAGSFTLAADKSTYMSARFPEGGETLRTGNRPLTLSAGQVVDNIVVPMYHGGAITGRVLDAHGDPVEFAQVQALKLPRTGRGKPQQRSGMSTNDLGEFRLARLEPGKYVLMAMPQRRDTIENPGMPLGSSVEPQPLPTFYPAALSIDDAQAITVERGATASNVEIALVDGVASIVSGVVLDSSGQPVTRGGSVGVRPILKELPQNGIGSSGGGLKPDGTFTLRLTPGEYQLEARSMPVGAGGPPAPGAEQFASMRITVAGDMTGLALQLGPGARVSGRLVFDGSAPPPQPPSTPNGPPIFTSPDGMSCRSGRTQLNADWTFTTDGVFGACMARYQGGFGQWFFKAIVYDGKDLTDQTIAFASGQRMRDVTVVFTDKRTELNLHVVDELGAPTREYVALAFSTDKSKWIDGSGGFMPNSRYVRTYMTPPERVPNTAAASRPGAPVELTGPPRMRESLVGLPSGEYYVIAVDDLESDAVRDPDVLEQLSRGATRVAIADGEPVDVNLRRVKLAR